MIQSYNGKGEFSKVEEIVDRCRAKKIFIVTGRTFFERLGISKRLEVMLKGKSFHRYSDFSPNPRVSEVEIGVEQCREFQPDLLLGIGGGSVLDMTKLISVSFREDMIADTESKDGLRVSTRNIPLVLVPTTAGSGSEATHFAVVYAENKKYSVSSQELLPNYVILDPELTFSLPKNIAAASAFDALSHAIESYWSLASSPESRAYATASLESIIAIFDNLMTKPSYKDREAMLMAAHQSGKAINLTKTTAAHALSYGFTTRYGIQHGHAVMMTLPQIFLLHCQADERAINSRISVVLHRERMGELCKLLGVQDGKCAFEKLRSMISLSGLQFPIRVHERREEEISALIQGVNSNRMNNNPVVFSNNDLKTILAQAVG